MHFSSSHNTVLKIMLNRFYHAIFTSILRLSLGGMFLYIPFQHSNANLCSCPSMQEEAMSSRQDIMQGYKNLAIYVSLI